MLIVAFVLAETRSFRTDSSKARMDCSKCHRPFTRRHNYNLGRVVRIQTHSLSAIGHPRRAPLKDTEK